MFGHPLWENDGSQQFLHCYSPLFRDGAESVVDVSFQRLHELEIQSGSVRVDMCRFWNNTATSTTNVLCALSYATWW